MSKRRKYFDHHIGFMERKQRIVILKLDNLNLNYFPSCDAWHYFFWSHFMVFVLEGKSCWAKTIPHQISFCFT